MDIVRKTPEGGLAIKKILLIGTGGTIASLQGAEGLAPGYDVAALLAFVPEVLRLAAIDALQIMNIDSTNMQPEHWMEITAAIREKYFAYDGFVITHGTDTLAYTAAMLSYLIQNSAKPIVVTGSQKPMTAPRTDARKNLRDAICLACEDIGGIYVVFDGNVINGNRAVKIRTKSHNAFESVNYPCVATIKQHQISYNPVYHFPPRQGDVRFYPAVATDVMLIKLTPGEKPEIFDFIKGKYRGVVVESFGSGGVPFVGGGNILTKMEELIAAGMIIVITTQCLFEGGNLNLYEVGQKILKSPIIPAYDMTTEAALTKLMWALGQTSGFAEVRELFLTPINYDLTLNGVS